MTQVEFMTLLCSYWPVGIVRASADATECQAWYKTQEPELPATPTQTSWGEGEIGFTQRRLGYMEERSRSVWCTFPVSICPAPRLESQAKTDIADAFCIVPLHPSQYSLFGFVWREQFYYDRCLPMGCSASCKIFETRSNALQWIASSKLQIRNISHLLDDFLLLARDKAVGQAQMSAFLSMCADIGIPSAPDKTVQPTQVITFLGLELDSVAMEVRLPVDKLNRDMLKER